MATATNSVIHLRYPEFFETGMLASHVILNTTFQPMSTPKYETTMLFARGIHPNDFIKETQKSAVVQFVPNHFTFLANQDKCHNPVLAPNVAGGATASNVPDSGGDSTSGCYQRDVGPDIQDPMTNQEQLAEPFESQNEFPPPMHENRTSTTNQSVINDAESSPSQGPGPAASLAATQGHDYAVNPQFETVTDANIGYKSFDLKDLENLNRVKYLSLYTTPYTSRGKYFLDIGEGPFQHLFTEEFIKELELLCCKKWQKKFLTSYWIAG